MADDSTSTLQIPEDNAWQERLWTAQRVGWVLMLLFVLAALAGLTGGGGPLSTATVRGTVATIDYPRIARWQAADDMKVTLPPDATGDFDLELSSAVLDTFAIDSISPQPDRSIATPGGHRYTFKLGEPGARKTLVFHIRPAHPAWPTRATAILDGRERVSLHFTVLP